MIEAFVITTRASPSADSIAMLVMIAFLSDNKGNEISAAHRYVSQPLVRKSLIVSAIMMLSQNSPAATTICVSRRL